MNDCSHFAILLFITFAIDGTAALNPDTDDSTDPSHFEHATQSPYFVDKTAVLKLFKGPHSFSIITSPRGFGKSTVVDMARRFFRITMNGTTTREIQRNTTRDYQLFSNQSLDLEIFRDTDFVKRYYGKYPVLYFNFANVQGTTSEEILQSFKDSVHRGIESFRWLYNHMWRERKKTGLLRLKFRLEYWDKFYDGTKCWLEYAANVEQIADSIHRHFRKHLMVFIDDYDAPTLRAINHGVNSTEIDKHMYSLLKTFSDGNELAINVMAVGQSRLFVQGLFGPDETDYYQRHNFLHSDALGQYLGFNEQDVDRLLTKNKVDNDQKETLKKYFNGYHFGKKIRKSAATAEPSFYNAQGIIRYLETNKLEDPHIANDHIIPKIMKCLRHEQFFIDISNLLIKRTENLHINLNISKSHSETFSQIVRTNCLELPPHTPYMTLFFDYGFLVHSKGSFKISNLMAQNKLKSEFVRFFLQTYNVNVANTSAAISIPSVMNWNNVNEATLTKLAHSFGRIAE